jgi:hypothetical protein
VVTRTDCPCGKADLSSAQMTMHRRSKAHKEWAVENGEIEDVASAGDSDFEGILSAARQGEDVRHIAKMTRSIFRARGWPSDEHPETVRDWLNLHNIPIIDVPIHSDPDEQRKHISEETERIRLAGWGKGWNIT